MPLMVLAALLLAVTVTVQVSVSPVFLVAASGALVMVRSGAGITVMSSWNVLFVSSVSGIVLSGSMRTTLVSAGGLGCAVTSTVMVIVRLVPAGIVPPVQLMVLLPWMTWHWKLLPPCGLTDWTTMPTGSASRTTTPVASA